jgi:high-affinity iron transporter
MRQILIITLREGIEAYLIIAITAGILRQTGRAALLPALSRSTGVAVVNNEDRRPLATAQ